ncbi:MAG: DNA adenine methylase [Treponema sp.]|nr:DNA adenine methylase [Treponema sp.]
MRNYGFPYKGSKNRLAEKIVKLFPDAENFYDLFCGGCAITHRALIENRWKNYVINDIDSRCPKLFLDAINGKFKNETRWISREDFYNLKDDDGYVAFCWSFGNDGKSYLYSKEIEPWKKALHFAIIFNDYSLGKELGMNLSVVDGIKGVTNRRLFLQKYLKGKDSPLKRSINKNNILHTLNRLQSLESLERLERLERLCKSYDEIEIKPNSIIYCDIPYKGTDDYNGINFDYERFYSWSKNQKELCFISSYEMPEDFIPIAEFPHRSILSATKNNLVLEKVFIPKHQLELYKARISACI